MLGQQLAIDEYLIVTKLDRFTRQTYDTLYVVQLIGFDRRPPRGIHFRAYFVAGIFENDNVSARDLPLRQKRKRVAARRKNELVHQQIIADQDRILHRAVRDGDR